HAAFVRAQAARLREDLARDADLADVVQQRAELESLECGVVEPETAADAKREVGVAPRVRRGVLLVRLERVRERLDGRDERALEPFVVARVRDRELGLVRETAEEAQLLLAAVVADEHRDDGAETAVEIE